ncbi:phosphoribosyltransferase [Roseococcus sp. SYP-B2431]|uniref:phosphoribosyltransferase n=1 Tax=Roseococcus sp. SYP-B2431 TaxID=2496640 RepID=UPI00103F250C|nr:phosphoribosyltransferase [Roseococcus sp. SYP-B2431]TCH99806.1 phosphoribosyltransferase [Roseococcus sp. SYP-B2431]
MQDPWQQFDSLPDPGPPYRDRYPVAMPDGSFLHMPIRPIGVAGLIATQASFPVIHALAGWMAAACRDLRPEVVLGLSTLGHVFAPLLAERLGHSNWVAAGYSRKLWYDEALSVPMRSITTTAERRVWLDPRMLPRLQGRRVLLVDDVISTGSSAVAGLGLLAAAGMRPVGLCVAMIQTRRWEAGWPADIPIVTVCETPRFEQRDGAWLPVG